MTTIKLYDIPQGSKIKAETFNESGKIGDFITFHRLDGAYSYCTIDGLDKDNVCHLSVMQPLVDKGDYYELVSDEK